jgi:hypothetical protein
MYGGAALGAVGLGVGIVTGAMTLSTAQDVQPQCDNNICAPAASDDLDTASTLGTVSTIAFIAGVAGIAGAVIGFMLPRQRAAIPGATLTFQTIAVGPAGLRGTF